MPSGPTRSRIQRSRRSRVALRSPPIASIASKSCRRVDQGSVALEELDGALVALGRRQRLEGAQVLPLARARVLLARIEAEPARLQLPDHGAKLRIGRALCQPGSGWRTAGLVPSPPSPNCRPLGGP